MHSIEYEYEYVCEQSENSVALDENTPNTNSIEKVWVSLSLCSLILVIGVSGRARALNTTSPTLCLSVVYIAGIPHTAHGRHIDGP